MNCESCGMPIEKGKYCQYCAPNGKLKTMEEVRESWSNFVMKQEGISKEEALKKVDEAMKKLPAWKKR